jgi:polysaccharide deacetylase 2 family uncharacterized protein YibQ
MPRPTTKSPKTRSTRRKPALLPLLKRFRPTALAAGALALTFGAGALVGFLYQHESDQPPAQVVTTRPEPVRPTAPRIELPHVEPPRVQAQARAEEEAPTPPSPQPSPPIIVPPLPKPTPPTVLAAMLPPPVPPSVAPVPVAPGSPLWQKNALPFAPRSSGPMIAIVIDDMGLDRKRSSRVVGLPAPLTLAWLPYANDLPHQTKTARAAGHELMVHIPMEPQASDVDPGPDAMKVGIGNAELLRRLDRGLKSFDGYIGINNHMGSRFTEDAAGMKVILGELQRRGLMFLDSRTTSHSVASSIARGMHLPALGRDVFLDDDMSPVAVRASLAKVEAVARRQGYAIAIGHPHDATVDALVEWLPAVAAKGFTLVPVSAILKNHQPSG